MAGRQFTCTEFRQTESRLAFKKSLEPPHGVLQLLNKNFYSVLLLHLLKPLFSVFHGLQALSIFFVLAQELEVRSLYHRYSLKIKSSQCHYVVMTRSETKFQAPLNRRYQEVLAKIEHLTIKTMSTGHARHG